MYFLSGIVKDAIGGKTVIAGSLGTIIDKHLILVFGLEETTHSARRQSVLLDKFIAVVSLFQEDGGMILLIDVIVLHAIVWIESLSGPNAANIDIATLQARSFQVEMHHDILSRCDIVVIVRTANHIDAILVLYVSVGASWLFGIERGMIIWLKPIDAVNTRCRTVYIENLKEAVLAASGKDELAVVCELYSVWTAHIGYKIIDTTVPASVLHHYDFKLTLGVNDRKCAETHGKRHLLVVAIEVDVGIAAHLRIDACHLLVDAETRLEHGGVLVTVVILLIDTQTVVAAQAEPKFLVGDAQAVVRVNLRRIETFLKVLDELVVESFQKITLKDAVRWLPIPVAMVYVVDVALVVVAHLIPFDVYVLPASKRHIWWQSRVVIYSEGKRPHIFVEDLLGLGICHRAFAIEH